MTYLDKIKEILVEEYGVDPKRVDELSHLENDLGLDSLDLVEFEMQIEEEFDLIITGDDPWFTVGECVEVVTRMMINEPQ